MKITIKTIKELKTKLNINNDVDIFSVRGCELTEKKNYCKWNTEFEIIEKEIDHLHMNCLIVLIVDDKMIAFKSSTVPNKKYIEKSLNNNGNGTNQLELGFYKYYAKGNHRPSKQTAHRALRQTRQQPVRRTSDDLDFDFQDRIDIGMFHDNIHASWSKFDGTTCASAGCQVISGYPKCLKRKENSGHWKTFENEIYSIDKKTFNYMVVSFKWINRIVNNKMNELVIFGSSGYNVKQIQKYLKTQIDGVYGVQTYKAILNYQKVNGLLLDGIIGSQTKGKMQ